MAEKGVLMDVKGPPQVVGCEPEHSAILASGASESSGMPGLGVLPSEGQWSRENGAQRTLGPWVRSESCPEAPGSVLGGLQNVGKTPHSARSSRVPPPGYPCGSLPLFFARSSKYGATAPLPPIEGNMVALRTLHKIPHFEIILGPGKPHAMSAAGTRKMPRLKRGRQEEIVPPRDCR